MSKRSRPQTESKHLEDKDGEKTSPGQEYKSYMADQSGWSGEESPDVLLDVPVLNVEELNLDVEDLRVHVSSRAEISDLVKVHVGIDAYLGNVKLEVKGLEAQALLKVKLNRVLETLDRALDSINRNPQILDRSLQNTNQALEGPGDAAAQAGEGASDIGEQADQTTQGAEDAAGQPSEETSDLAKLQTEEEYIDDQGQVIGRAHNEMGNIVEEILDEEGNVPNRPDGGEEVEKIEATDAARIKADELGVNLTEVKGTGSGGRIIARDVQRVANKSR